VQQAFHGEIKTMCWSCLLLRSLECAAYATFQEKQKRNEVNIRSVERDGFTGTFGTSNKNSTA
jgi:hypothetical protein